MTTHCKSLHPVSGCVPDDSLNLMGGPRDTRTCVSDSCQALTLACPLISEQFVAFLAAAFKGAHCVPAEVIAASVVLLAFVDV